MRRFISFTAALMIISAVLSGCGQQTSIPDEATLQASRTSEESKPVQPGQQTNPAAGNVSKYAEEILNSNNETYASDILQIILDKCSNGEELEKLTSPEKTIYFVGTLDSEIGSGGFSQYLAGDNGKHAKETVKAMKDIGASYTAGLLSEAISVYGKGPVIDEETGAEEGLTPEQDEKLIDLDNKYFERKENIYNLEIAFVRKHLGDF